MAVTAKWYGKNVLDQWGAAPVNWVSDTIKVSLHASTYVPNQDLDEFFSATSAELATAGGYTAGGVTLGTKSVSYDGPTNEARLIAGNASWASATFTCRIGVIYKSTGVAGTSPVMGYVDMGADQSVSSGTFTIQWDATGVLKGVAA
jgi:hypothetical protein